MCPRVQWAVGVVGVRGGGGGIVGGGGGEVGLGVVGRVGWRSLGHYLWAIPGRPSGGSGARDIVIYLVLLFLFNPVF